MLETSFRSNISAWTISVGGRILANNFKCITKDLIAEECFYIKTNGLIRYLKIGGEALITDAEKKIRWTG